MRRQPLRCDFCGALQVADEYPTDSQGISFYACPECARLIDAEGWDLLIERGHAACSKIRPLRDDEKLVLRKQMEQLVENFRVIRLAPV